MSRDSTLKKEGRRSKFFLSGNEVMRLAGFTNRNAFRSWQMAHRLRQDHNVGMREYFLRSEVEKILGISGQSVQPQ